jgi:hypothetical protein
MNPKEVFFRKIEDHKPQILEIASEAGLLNLNSSTAHELISKWVMHDAAATGLQPVAKLSVLRARLNDLERRWVAHRQQISPAFFAILSRPLVLACMALQIALIRVLRNRAEIRDVDRRCIRDAGAEMLLSMFEHYRVRGAAAAALKQGGMNQYA